ncbi:hypothetical protein [uncultured Cellulomonas sp.]|uniref:hypothetical protein n=1 Tax=uncultured Cellulomonas sp. TaxID=189682 RepID=UPI0028E53D31|nr:hypothetical protein [uncultured Cellulomonas sp.]
MSDGDGADRHPPRRLGRLALVALSPLVVGISLLSAASAASAATAPAASVASVPCDEADRLTEAGRPRDALALLGDYAERATDPGATASPAVCSTERAAAAGRIARAEHLAGLVPVVRETPTAPGDLPTGCGSRVGSPAPAVPWDRRSVEEAARTCDADVPIPTTNRITAFGDTVAATATTYQQPVWLALVAAVAVVLAIEILARLLAPVVPERMPWNRYAAVRRTGNVLVPVAVVVICAALGTDEPAPWVVGSGVVLGLAALAFRTWQRARTPSVQVEVSADGKQNKEEAVRVVALLRELGGETPRGIFAPVGTDVTELSDAVLSTTPTNPVLGLVFQVVKTLLPSRQGLWHVLIDVSTPRLQTVQVMRRGHAVASAVVDADVLKLPVTGTAVAAGDGRKAETAVPAPDLFQVSAAMVLLAMSERYHFDGLYGTTRWESLGLHCLATTQYAGRPQARPLLVRAVEIDWQNGLARHALAKDRYRKAVDVDELLVYERLLRTLREGLAQDRVHDPSARWLDLRAAISLSVALVNRYFADTSAPHRRRLLTEADSAIADGLGLSGALATEAPANLLPARALMELRPLSVTVQILLTPPGSQARREAVRRAAQDYGSTGRSPKEAYAWACLWASVPAEQDAVTRAVRNLRFADVDDELAQWRTRDPQLRTLRTCEQYAAAYPRKPSTDVLALPMVEPFATKLRAGGIVTADQLHDQLTDAATRSELGAMLGAFDAALSRVQVAADLVRSVPATVRTWRIEVARILLARGLETAEHVRRLPPAERKIAREALLEELGTFIPPPSRAERLVLQVWLRPAARR